MTDTNTNTKAEGAKPKADTFKVDPKAIAGLVDSLKAEAMSQYNVAVAVRSAWPITKAEGKRYTKAAWVDVVEPMLAVHGVTMGYDQARKVRTVPTAFPKADAVLATNVATGDPITVADVDFGYLVKAASMLTTKPGGKPGADVAGAATRLGQYLTEATDPAKPTPFTVRGLEAWAGDYNTKHGNTKANTSTATKANPAKAAAKAMADVKQRDLERLSAEDLADFGKVLDTLTERYTKAEAKAKAKAAKAKAKATDTKADTKATDTKAKAARPKAVR